MRKRLLIIEDDTSLNQMLALHFEDQDFAVTSAFDCASAKAAVADNTFDLTLMDQQLPDGLGIELLPHLLEVQPELTVIMMTGQHDLELAIQAIRMGATDFVHKPIQSAALQLTVDSALNRKIPSARATGGGSELPAVRDLIGRSAAMLEVSKAIALAAGNKATVLITGESGTGKEVVARLIYQHSGQSGPFVAINCAAIVETLLESELFGHEKGALTGAVNRKPGRFEQAQGGTLFLDEIGELALPLQAKLLRAVQEKTFERVGGTESLSSDARLIAATHRDLFAAARDGRFREDLAYRLNVLSIHLPPLRERREDIPLLTEALLNKAAAEIEVPPPPITQAAMARLTEYDWPGNVRELENVLTRAVIQARDGAITPDILLFSASLDRATTSGEVKSAATPAGPVLRTLDEVEAEHVQRVLNHTRGHKGRTCEILDISRPALDRKITKYKLDVPKDA